MEDSIKEATPEGQSTKDTDHLERFEDEVTFNLNNLKSNAVKNSEPPLGLKRVQKESVL